ncbi:MAG: DUF4166 domain-containing protein [Sphingomonadales bacterium]
MNFSFYRNYEQGEYDGDGAAKPATAVQSGSLSDLRFARLVGKTAWFALPNAVRQRFSKRLKSGQSVVYKGRLIETRMSRMGWILAQLLRAIGGPLPLDTHDVGQEGAAVVTVTEAPGGRGQFWTRQYNRQRGFPQVIHSMIQFSGPTGLEEGVGYGIGMTLTLKTEADSLLFCSAAYFVTLLGQRLYLPRWLTRCLMLGDLVIGHHDLGNGAFDFTLDLTHPLFGTLIHQRARFFDMETAP